MPSQVRSSKQAAPVRRVGKGPAPTGVVETKNHLLIEIAEWADADEAQRACFDLARSSALDSSVAERAAFIASEAAVNILKHAGEGRQLLRVMWEAAPVVEIIALDRGPGITHLGAAMRGGYSTSGDPGAGLCAMSRAANLFDIYSRPGQGTALLARVSRARGPGDYAARRDHAQPRVKSGVISTPKAGTQSGEWTISDAWAAKHQPSRSLVMVADGLGHGAEAAMAATEAVSVIERVHALSPAEILEEVHETLGGTRGASVAVAEIRLSGSAPEVRFAGVGNIAARVVNGDRAVHLVSLNGIAGYEAEIQEFTYPWPAHSALVLHSDGLAPQWNAGDYPGLLASHPALIAAVLHRDFNRGLDDATVVVAKQ
ncbi:MAG: SpoIIE family protein phosphatase [Blastocatellia bacterium]